MNFKLIFILNLSGANHDGWRIPLINKPVSRMFGSFICPSYVDFMHSSESWIWKRALTLGDNSATSTVTHISNNANDPKHSPFKTCSFSQRPRATTQWPASRFERTKLSQSHFWSRFINGSFQHIRGIHPDGTNHAKPRIGFLCIHRDSFRVTNGTWKIG